MATIGTFEKTRQKTEQWLEDVAHYMGSTDMERGYHVLRAVLHTLRDRLPPDEAVDLGAQLPMLVRGFYYEGWHPADKPEKYRDKEEFLSRIAREVPELDPAQRERAAGAVFTVLNQHVSGGEIREARAAMPEEVRELWPRDDQD